MKFDLKFVREKFEEEGYRLLDTKYVNAHTKLNYECPLSHKNSMSFNNFKKNRRCPECRIQNRKIPFEKIKLEFEKEGYKLLSEYIDYKTKMKYQCPKGHIGEMSYDRFKQNRKCAECSSTKLTHDFVKVQFEKREYKLLDTYINYNTKMKYECPFGHIGEISYSNFLKNDCSKCYGNRKLTIEEVKVKFEERDYELLEGEYVNSATKIKYKCPKGHIGKICYNSFRDGSGCSKCLFKNEQRCRKIMEDFFGVPFDKSRPPWLKGLELDGYNEEFGIAFEYDGAQHYKYVQYWHKTPKGFFIQRKRDLEKFFLCKINGVKLIKIPYYNDDSEFIKDKLIEIFF